LEGSNQCEIKENAGGARKRRHYYTDQWNSESQCASHALDDSTRLKSNHSDQMNGIALGK